MLTRAMLVLTGALLLQANKPADPAALFGLRESVEQISMSPDGTKLAYITPRDGQGSALYTVTLDGSEPKLVTVADGDPQRLSHCRWISDRRLVCTIFAMVRADRRNLPVSRLVAVNADGSGFQLLCAGDPSRICGPLPMKSRDKAKLVKKRDSSLSKARSVTGAMAMIALNRSGATTFDCNAA